MGKDLKGKELGTGISQRKDGRYHARVTYKGQQIAMYGHNFQELKRRVTEAKEQIDKGLAQTELYTCNEWFETWFDTYKKPMVKPQSVAPMKRKVQNTFLKYIGDMKLGDLRSIDVQTALNELLAEGRIAPGSLSEALGRLRECFASAVNNRFMLTNPAFDISVPFSEGEQKERRWFSPEEISVFLDAAKDSWWYEMLYVAIFTGLRIGEIGGLKWKDIHWSTPDKPGYIEVNQALASNYEDGVKTLRLGSLKTANSHRKIPFFKDTEAMLRSQQEKVEKLKRDLGTRYRSTGEFEDLVFVSSMGSPCMRYNAEHTINKLIERINFAESYKAKREGREPVLMERAYPHALRHTFASLCYLADIDAKVTQRMMGHASYSTTIDIYTHIGEAYMTTDTRKLDSFEIPDLAKIA